MCVLNQNWLEQGAPFLGWVEGLKKSDTISEMGGLQAERTCMRNAQKMLGVRISSSEGIQRLMVLLNQESGLANSGPNP